MKSTSILLAEDDVNLGNLLKNYPGRKVTDTSLFTNGNLALKAFPEAVFQLYNRYNDA